MLLCIFCGGVVVMAILRHHQAGAYNNQWYFGGVLTACVTQNGGWNTVRYLIWTLCRVELHLAV